MENENEKSTWKSARRKNREIEVVHGFKYEKNKELGANHWKTFQAMHAPPVHTKQETIYIKQK